LVVYSAHTLSWGTSMRAGLAILALSLLILSGCNTLRGAAQVATKLGEKPDRVHHPDEDAIKQGQEDVAAMDAKLRQMQANGHKPTDAELRAMAKQLVSGKPASGSGKSIPPPDDQEISVNLIYAGMAPGAAGNSLDFDFKALWGNYKEIAKEANMPVHVGHTESHLDLGTAHVKVVPKIVSGVRGKYELEITDRSGSLIGRFEIADTGKQVEITSRPSKYDATLLYFEPEKRLTGYTFYKPGTREAQLGVIFVGKGYSYVENSKRPDTSKGYIFPEVDMIVLPKAWCDGHDMKDTCNTVKRGEESASGGVCYS
jgi:hypothetical protein